MKNLFSSYNDKLVFLSQKLRKNMTPEERKLWYQFLRKYSVQFKRQQIFANYIVDFYCPKVKLAIELDGGGHYTPEQKEYDDERTRKLGVLGIKVIRFCNIDVKKNFYGVCFEIDRHVKSLLSDGEG